MLEVRTTDTFRDWLAGLRDVQAWRRIVVRIDRLQSGNPGQHRALPGGVCEMKIDHGPGYRVYYTERCGVVVILLCGGDKASQQADIAAALRMSKSLES